MAELTKEQKEERAQLSKRNLENAYITGVAASHYGTPEQYGKILENLYAHTISQAPNQEAYEQMILDDIMSDTGALTMGRIKAKAALIVQESVETIHVADALKLTGVGKDISDKYKDKYVNELDEDEKVELINAYVTNMTHQRAEQTLEAQRKIIAGNLEKKFCADDKPASESESSSSSSGSSSKPKRARRKAK